MLIRVGILLIQILNPVCFQRATEPKGLSLVKKELIQDIIIYLSFKRRKWQNEGKDKNKYSANVKMQMCLMSSVESFRTV